MIKDGEPGQEDDIKDEKESPDPTPSIYGIDMYGCSHGNEGKNRGGRGSTVSVQMLVSVCESAAGGESRWKVPKGGFRRGGGWAHTLTIVCDHARYTLGITSPATPYIIPLTPQVTPASACPAMRAVICEASKGRVSTSSELKRWRDRGEWAEARNERNVRPWRS